MNRALIDMLLLLIAVPPLYASGILPGKYICILAFNPAHSRLHECWSIRPSSTDTTTKAVLSFLVMLLRIDVHPGSFERESSLDQRTTHHVSVGTGARWTLGRKNATAEIKDDKTLSREHMALFFCSTKSHPDIVKATHPAHVKACEQEKGGICLLLQNYGKLGTFLVRPDEPKPAPHETKKKKDDGDDSDATTDDEMGSPQYLFSQQQQSSKSQLDVAISPVAKHYLPAGARLETIPWNGNVPLHFDDKPVIIQCGKFGTTIVITRLPLNLVCSGEAKVVVARLPLYRIGAVQMDRIVTNHNNGTTTTTTADYIVTPSYSVSPKQLAGWCHALPFVTADYIQAWLERTKPLDPIPAPHTYRPAADTFSFWSMVHRRSLFRNCTLLLTQPPEPDEYELLCQAAGMKVVPLYDGQSLLADDVVQAIVHQNAPHCFVMYSKRKIAKFLNKLQVPLITGKELAQAITEQRALTDKKGYQVAPISIEEEEQEERTAERVDDDKNRQNEREESVSVSSSSKMTIRQSNASQHGTKHSRDEEADAVVVAKNNNNDDDDKSKRKKKKNNEPPTTNMDVDSIAKKADTSTGKEANANGTAIVLNQPVELPEDALPEADDEMPYLEGPPEKVAVIATATSPPKRLRVEYDSITKALRGGERKSRTVVGKDGWLKVLPQGKARERYQRTLDEIKAITRGDDDDGDDVPTGQTATVVVSGLVKKRAVVGSSTTTSARRGSAMRQGSNDSAFAGPNFKTFRKNSVPPLPSSNRIKLFLVAPQGHRVDMRTDMEDEALEQQQRLADELFRDPSTVPSSSSFTRPSRRR